MFQLPTFNKIDILDNNIQCVYENIQAVKNSLNHVDYLIQRIDAYNLNQSSISKHNDEIFDLYTNCCGLCKGDIKYIEDVIDETRALYTNIDCNEESKLKLNDLDKNIKNIKKLIAKQSIFLENSVKIFKEIN